MKKTREMAWKHSGRRSHDYGRSKVHDHDRRTYAASGFWGMGPKGGPYRSDERIEEQVSELLYWNPDVDASDVEVTVKDAVVYLDGSVDSRHAKKVAERAIEYEFGVADVQNRLHIKPKLDVDSDKVVARGEDGLFTQETIQH